MVTKTVRQCIRLAGVLWLPFVAAADPRAAIDTLEVNFDTVYEKNVTYLTHIFSIKNTGDSPLQLYNIRPGCGCTTFTNDSFIQPGKIGHITMELDLSEVGDGAFFKYLKVSTNDPRYPRARFAFFGVHKSIIRVEPTAVVLPTAEKKDTVQTVTLYTEKPDLQVTKVSFVMDNQSAAWSVSVSIRFQFRKMEKKDAAGRWKYLLQINYFPVTGAAQYGNFIVKTNHPDKPELKISGVLYPEK